MRVESLRDQYDQFPDIDGYWSHNDLARTERELLAVAVEPMGGTGPWPAKLLEDLTQLARLQGLLGNLREGKATLERVRSHLHELGEAERVRPELRYLLEMGRLLCLEMMPAKAQAFFSQARELAFRHDDVFFAIDATVMMATARPQKQKNDWVQEAIALAEKTANQNGKLWLSFLYVMDGWYLFDMRRYEEALRRFEKSAQMPRSSMEGKSSVAAIWATTWAIARTKRALEKVDEALAIQKQLQAEMEILGRTNGHVFLEIGECLQILQKHTEAKTFFESAHVNLSQDTWYVDNRASELSRMHHLFKKR